MHHQTTEEAVDEVAEFLGVPEERKPALRALMESCEKPVTVESLKASMVEIDTFIQKKQ